MVAEDPAAWSPPGWLPEWAAPQPTWVKVGNWGMESDRIWSIVTPDQELPIYFYIAQQTYYGNAGYTPLVEVWTEGDVLCRRRCVRSGLEPSPVERLAPHNPERLADVFRETADGMVRAWRDEFQRWWDG